MSCAIKWKCEMVFPWHFVQPCDVIQSNFAFRVDVDLHRHTLHILVIIIIIIIISAQSISDTEGEEKIS